MVDASTWWMTSIMMTASKPGWHGVARIDPHGLLAHREPQGRRLRRPNRLTRPHRHAIHGRRVVMRRGAHGPDRRRGDAPMGLVQRQRFRLCQGERSRLSQGVVKLLQSLREWNIAEVVLSRMCVYA